jgi:hypothetical protein
MPCCALLSTYEVEVGRVESYPAAIAVLCGRAVVTAGQMNEPVVQPSRLRPEHRPRRGQRFLAPGGAETAAVGQDRRLGSGRLDRAGHHAIGPTDTMLIVVEPLVGRDPEAFECGRAVGHLGGLLLDGGVAHEIFKPLLLAKRPVEVGALQSRAGGVGRGGRYARPLIGRAQVLAALALAAVVAHAAGTAIAQRKLAEAGGGGGGGSGGGGTTVMLVATAMVLRGRTRGRQGRAAGAAAGAASRAAARLTWRRLVAAREAGAQQAAVLRHQRRRMRRQHPAWRLQPVGGANAQKHQRQYT